MGYEEIDIEKAMEQRIWTTTSEESTEEPVDDDNVPFDLVFNRAPSSSLKFFSRLRKVFKHFRVSLEKVMVATRKKMFILKTLDEYECVAKIGGVGTYSMISNLIEA
ncbi:hypothetical protein HAX54_017395 [Datura stramonium]|uniref:Uncharacterized protein n=1 Tax=Datura stramonium TaxID=4076 RepID=A0ABS8UMW5_DATST|nr:hypothetical protein [Datura stramonium]